MPVAAADPSCTGRTVPALPDHANSREGLIAQTIQHATNSIGREYTVVVSYEQVFLVGVLPRVLITDRMPVMFIGEAPEVASPPAEVVRRSKTPDIALWKVASHGRDRVSIRLDQLFVEIYCINMLAAVSQERGQGQGGLIWLSIDRDGNIDFLHFSIPYRHLIGFIAGERQGP